MNRVMFVVGALASMAAVSTVDFVSAAPVTVAAPRRATVHRLRSFDNVYRGEQMLYGPRWKRSAKQRNKSYAK